MKRTLLIISLLISSQIIFCQESPVSIKGFESVEEYFDKQYLDPMRRFIYPYTIDTLCEKGCSFMSFVVNKKGEISNIRFNSTTPQVVKDLFTRICQESNDKWVINEATLQNEIKILIPFYYDFYRTEGVKCNRKTDNCDNVFFNMMSAFEDSELNTRMNIERTKLPKNVLLYSPLYFKSIFYFKSNSK